MGKKLMLYNKRMRKLKTKKVKGRVSILKVLPYLDCPVYIRLIDNEIFMYDLLYNNQLYSSYLIIRPKKGMTKLSDSEINQASALIYTGAMATIDTLKGNGPDEKMKAVVDTFEANRDKIDRKAVN